MISTLQRIRGSYDKLIDAGLDPAAAGCTYEWTCRACRATTHTSHAGGNLLKGTCEPHCAAEDLDVYVMLAGEREHLGTAASFCR